MPEVFGPFELKRLLGAGSMGEVYLAFDTKRGMDVALKRVRHGTDPDARAKVEAEKEGAELQGRVWERTERVPRVFEFGDLDGYFYIAMEYVSGPELSEVIRRGSLTYERIAEIAYAVCDALVDASRTVLIGGREKKAIVHGDIKPKNIRLDDKQVIKLLDFGIAKSLELRDGFAPNGFATAEYSAPERLVGEAVDVRSDVWSVGVLIYEMATGRPPFRGPVREIYELIQSGRRSTPLPVDFPDQLRSVLDKALAPDPSKRYQTAEEMKADLWPMVVVPEPTINIRRDGHGAGNGGGGDKRAKPIRSTGQATPPARRRAWRRAAVALGVIAIAVVSVYEGYLYAKRDRLRGSLASAPISRWADAEPYVGEFESLSSSGFLDYGMPPMREQMRRSLLGVADHWIDDFRQNKPEAKESHWKDALATLDRARQLGLADGTVEARARYCQGQIEFIGGMRLLRDAAEATDTLFTDAIRGEAKERFKKAVGLFNEAASLEANWPDPHFGLAIVYPYGLRDFEQAAKELQRAKAMGINLAAEREVAIRADNLRMYGQFLSRDAGERAKVKELYRDALDLYRKIPDFSPAVPRYIRELERRLADLEQPERTQATTPATLRR